MRNKLKCLVLLSAVVVTAVLLAASVLLISCGTKITKANCDRIHLGATRAEVDAVLGQPRWWGVGVPRLRINDTVVTNVHSGIWQDDDANKIYVAFDNSSNLVVAKEFHVGVRSSSILDEIRRLLRKLPF